MGGLVYLLVEVWLLARLYFPRQQTVEGRPRVGQKGRLEFGDLVVLLLHRDPIEGE